MTYANPITKSSNGITVAINCTTPIFFSLFIILNLFGGTDIDMERKVKWTKQNMRF